MDENSFIFIQNQFITLREEIKESKARGFRVIISGIIGTPILFYLSKTYNIDVLLFSLPAIVIIIALQSLSENHAIMRAGTYIKLHIEPYYRDICGWEKWLSCDNDFDSRTVDRYLSIAIMLLFSLYYIGASFLACRSLYENYNNISFTTITGAYVAIGIWFEIFLIKNLKTDTAKTTNVCRTNCVEKRHEKT
jgi:hypothetical protein